MKITVQVVLHADDDTQTVVREAFTLNRETLAPDTLGLQLAGGQRPARRGAGHGGRKSGDHRAVPAQIACPDCAYTALSTSITTLSNPGAADAPRLTARGSVSVGVTR
jgi:hypothetical protein